MQSSAVGDVLHCEEQLRSTLYSDDKDDLRRKLAQLQQEYLKTAQKLQRAERLEAVRKHVRNDGTPKQDQHQDQTEPEGTPKPTYGGPADSSSLVRTLLPSTPEPDLVRHNPPCVSRASPALRLRSRRSRMRWQSHSEEGGKVQGDARFADESQSSGSASPSLLLSHWNVPALEDEKQDGKKEAEVPDGNRTENHTVGGDGGHVTLDEKSHENLEKQASYFKPSFCSVETIAGGEGDGKRLLECCNLVEGLPFPAEYYIRTTRSMALSQSQPDLRAVIHTQLNPGRPRQKKANPVISSERSSPMSIAKTPMKAVSPPRVTRLRKGQKSQRGRGRGKPRVQRPSPSPGPSSRHETNSPKSHSSPEEVEPPSDDPKATSPDTQPSSGAQKVLPIFYKMVKSTPVASGSEKWRSLLLPSSKPTPTPLLPPLSQLAGDLLHLDLHQDFHLPDDQFASLKLSKLRQVAVESRAEPFASLCHNTGGVLRHPGTPVTTLSVPLSLTPMAGKSSSQSKDDDSWNTQLTGTSHLDPPSICQSPEEQELKCGDREREVLPCRDLPREEGQEENRLKDLFPKTVKNEHSVNSQLRLSPPVASAPLHPPSSTFPSSPVLPSLGFTPLASLPTATVVPSLSLPPLLSPSTRTLSPQHLAALDTPAPAPDVQMLTAVEEHRSCTLKAPAGGVLVDACCLLDSGGHLCIAAAGKWAVCLWSRASSSSDWTLRHTWPFTEPVINMFSVPDAAGLMCVTLGQLEIIEVRVLSCCGSKPGLLLDGGVQAAVGVAQSRVVTSSYSASGCTLQVFTLSNDGSTSRCVPLGSPGVCVGALAQVDALPDALIGTDEGGRLFVWNLKSGHLLQKIQLSDSLSNTSCLRGFSCSGVLLVLLQHLSLGCHQDEKNKSKDETFFKQEEEEKKSVLFSLVALNPLTGKSVLAARLDPPTSWSGSHLTQPSSKQSFEAKMSAPTAKQQKPPAATNNPPPSSSSALASAPLKEIPEVLIDTRAKRRYTRGRFLGKGGFAKCYEITDVESQEVFAGKIVPKTLITKPHQREKMTSEITIHKSLEHPNIVGFRGFFEDDDFVFVVLEICKRRSLLELHKRRKAVTEPEARYYMMQLLKGVQYLHNNRIIHRDLKLGNIFLNDDMDVKIGDFGLATKIEFDGERKKTLCGTPNYIAPEVLCKKGHSYEVDVWSLGCILYTLLVGKPPFETSCLKETYNRIKKNNYTIPWHINPAAATLIKRMLHADPGQRPTIAQMLSDDFFTSGYIPSRLPTTCLTVAPRFSIAPSTVAEMGQRRPLAALGNKGGSENVRDEQMPRDAEPAENNLKDLLLQLNSFLTVKPMERPLVRQGDGSPRASRGLAKRDSCHICGLVGAEEAEDPACIPIFWISKWVDYSDKYGLGYQLCDNSVGVLFNDYTRLVMYADGDSLQYIDKAAHESYMSVAAYPPTLNKKITLLKYFRNYMSEHLLKAGANMAPREGDELARLPYLSLWFRTKSAIVLHLSNGTVQINFFQDHTKLILCPLMSAVTYIDERRDFRTYKLSLLEEFGCSKEFFSRMRYAKLMVERLMDSSKATH